MTAGDTALAAYTCPYCRLASDGGEQSCPHCGAPTDVRARVSASGWVEQPAIRDMARLRFSRSTCQISGSYVPVAELRLDGDDSVYFGHHHLLYAEPDVKLDMRVMPDGWKRQLEGLPLLWMTARGPGHLALSADAAGETIAVPLQPGRPVDVTEYRFLAATGNVSYQGSDSGIWFRSKHKDGEHFWHHPIGQYLDTFTTDDQPGLLLLHAPGNVFVRDLDPGSDILVQCRSLVWKDRSVHASLHVERATDATNVNMWLKLRGPGRVAIKSVYGLIGWGGMLDDSSPRTRTAW